MSFAEFLNIMKIILILNLVNYSNIIVSDNIFVYSSKFLADKRLFECKPRSAIKAFLFNLECQSQQLNGDH